MYTILADELNQDLVSKFASKGILGAVERANYANEILNLASAAQKATVVDAASANALALELFDEKIGAVLADSTAKAPANPGAKTTTAAAPTEDILPGDWNIGQQFAMESYADGVTRSAASELINILTSKPRPADRFKSVEEMRITANEDLVKKFEEEYKGKLVSDEIAPGNSKAFAQALELVKKAASGTTVTTPIYINEKGRPTEAGYEIADKQADGGVRVIVKDENILTTIIAKDYAGRIPTNPDGSQLGVIIVKSVSNKEGNNGQKQKVEKVAARVRGKNSYYNGGNANGKPVYLESATETVEVSCRSALSFKVNNGDRVTKNGTVPVYKTVRLAGKASVAALDIDPKYVTVLQLSKSNGNFVGAHQRTVDISLVTAAIASLRAKQRNAKDKFSATEEAYDLAKKLKEFSTDGGAAGSID